MATVSQILYNNKYKRVYFYWKNNIRSLKYNFTDGLDEDEFIKLYLDNDTELFEKLQKWEDTEQYANVKKAYYTETKEQDFVKIFEVVRKKALEGDNPSIKTFILLQNEMGKVNKKITTIKDDDLVI